MAVEALVFDVEAVAVEALFAALVVREASRPQNGRRRHHSLAATTTSICGSDGSLQYPSLQRPEGRTNPLYRVT